jgi:sugar phosphate isomerase/epimerase
MRLGVAGSIVPNRLEAVDDRSVAKIADLGFSGVGTHFQGDPETIPQDALQRVRSIFANHGVRIVQAWSVPQAIISPDESVRRDAVRKLQYAVRNAAELGADMAGVRPGSMNPRGDWWPHPDNHTPEVEDTLVNALREAASACETYGVPIALETHVTSPLDSPERIKRVIERTGSPWIRLSLDPVNFIGDFQKLYHTTRLINDLFDTLGPYTIAAHVKDVYAEDRLVVHISETVPGDGLLDFDTFFRRFEALLPAGYAIIEHLPANLVPQAMAFVQNKLAELGIAIVG